MVQRAAANDKINQIEGDVIDFAAGSHMISRSRYEFWKKISYSTIFKVGIDQHLKIFGKGGEKLNSKIGNVENIR